MNWVTLTTKEQLSQIVENSHKRPQIIYKHSTRCGISSMVLKRLEKSSFPNNADFYFIDLIRYRNLSNEIAEKFHVHHESPQILLIKSGECVFDESHYSITMDDIISQVSSV
jgi:bacillithiol system protein YtxJ